MDISKLILLPVLLILNNPGVFSQRCSCDRRSNNISFSDGFWKTESDFMEANITESIVTRCGNNATFLCIGKGKDKTKTSIYNLGQNYWGRKEGNKIHRFYPMIAGVDSIIDDKENYKDWAEYEIAVVGAITVYASLYCNYDDTYTWSQWGGEILLSKGLGGKMYKGSWSCLKMLINDDEALVNQINDLNLPIKLYNSTPTDENRLEKYMQIVINYNCNHKMKRT